MYKRYFICFIIMICSSLLISCEKKIATVSATDQITITPTATPTVTLIPTPTVTLMPTPTVTLIPTPVISRNTITIDLKKYTNTDNTYPENYYETEEQYINKVYKTFDFDGKQLMVYDGTDHGLHIGIQMEGRYYSICQIDNWDSALDRATMEQDERSIIFDQYNNVLGTSGVHIIIWNGAASSNEFYVYMKEDKPSLLVSYCTGGFDEADIDQDNENELISYGGGLPTNFFLIVLKDNKLMWTDYLYYEGKPIYYNQDSNDFYIADEAGNKIYYKYDKAEDELIEYTPSQARSDAM
ncbi:MAG TPA: hypothetical protein VN258_18695 [Mobilitalea sp.]|nr:hypothetical protein [Mobilitalea sp.]